MNIVSQYIRFRITHIFGVLSLFSILLVCAADAQTDRLRITATINGKQVRLVYDTGFEGMITLFESSAKRLGLLPADGPTGWTSPCVFEFMGQSETVSIPITVLPSYVRTDYDGALGWHTLSTNVLKIEPPTNTFAFIPHGDIHPGERFGIINDVSYLTLQTQDANKASSRIVIDTGNDRGGVILTRSAWRLWRQEHRKLPSTLNGYYMPGVGEAAREEVWVKSYTLGNLVLQAVPVAEANPTEESIMGQAGAKFILGMAALRSSTLVLDGPNNAAYLDSVPGKLGAPTYNRLGAVFISKNGNADDMVATVLPKSPAYRSGIRDGDLLLAINGIDVIKLRAETDNLPLDRFWRMPAGTTHKITLKRKDKVLTKEVVLQEIFGLE